MAEADKPINPITVAGFRRVILKKLDVAVAAILGIVGIVVSLLYEARVAENRDQLLGVVIVGLTVLLVMMFSLYIVQLFIASRDHAQAEVMQSQLVSANGQVTELQDTLKNERDAARELSSRLGHEHEMSHARYHAISTCFTNLEHSHSKLDSIVIKLIASLVPVHRMLEADALASQLHLDAAHGDLLTNICNTAVEVLAAKKNAPRSLFCANIKIIERRESDCVYYTIARSSDAEWERYSHDKILKDSPKSVYRNLFYRKIIDTSPVTPMHYYCPDVQQLLNESQEDFEEPSAATKKFYRSCLVVPIMGMACDTYEDIIADQRSGLIKYLEQEDIIGFMCVDSPRPHMFDEHYDLNIMTQLRTQAFNGLRAFNAVKALTNVNLGQ